MTAHALPMPALPIRAALRSRFGSPGDWGKQWRDHYAAFLELLHDACDPDGQEAYIANEIERRSL